MNYALPDLSLNMRSRKCNCSVLVSDLYDPVLSITVDILEVTEQNCDVCEERKEKWILGKERSCFSEGEYPFRHGGIGRKGYVSLCVSRVKLSRSLHISRGR